MPFYSLDFVFIVYYNRFSCLNVQKTLFVTYFTLLQHPSFQSFSTYEGKRVALHENT